MLLTIIIVSYNTANLTLQTLESVVTDLRRSPKLKKGEIIVIDNASTDNSVSQIKTFAHQLHQAVNGPQLHLIQNRENTGFAQANNLGIKQAQGQFILLLNSDTIVQPGALRILVETFDKQTTAKQLGAVAALLLNQDLSLQPQGGSFPTLISLASHMLMLDDLPLLGRLLPSTQHTGRRGHPEPNQLTFQDWVGATAVLIRRAVFDEVGLLDENIFMYGEDVEFCIRVRNHGWAIAIQPQAQVVHLGSASSSSANALIGELKGYLYIWSKHKPFWQQPLARLLLKLGSQLRSWLFGTLIRDRSKAKIYRQALSEL